MRALLLIFFLIRLSLTGFSQVSWSADNDNFKFSWNLETDRASLEDAQHVRIWSGSLLPSFWLKINEEDVFLKPTVDLKNSEIGKDRMDLTLILGTIGAGKLTIERDSSSFSITKLVVNWDEVPEIVALYHGVTGLTPNQMAAVADPTNSFHPDWSAFAFCVPGAKEGPAQSFFRSWDFGQTDIPLGSFGPSMGTPYGAAFPRPTLMASMGSEGGWITFGAGSVPDAPMTLKVKGARGCIQFLYREDLWGKGAQQRIWDNLLTITLGKSAWESKRRYMNTIAVDKPVDPSHHLSVWNTWGNWKTGNYAIKPITSFAKKTGAEILVLDDPWESFHGSATYNTEKFPTFPQDIVHINELGMDHGIWETLAWVDRPDELGLTNDDLLLDRNGNPCKGSWNFDPFSGGNYILDISSENARQYLIERTKKVMQEIKPRLIKLDFGYGVSNPNVGVPRNPDIRGERYSYELIKLISVTAKGVDPDVTIMYYGISPFFLPFIDMVSLDDQGDLWHENKSGHDQWSIWASLISMHKTALNGSSGYDWDSDDEMLLNTVVIGSPGSVLPNQLDGKDIPERMINRRFAVNNWYRRSIQWEPLWLNSNHNGLSEPMEINCWGRNEFDGSGKYLSALVLRGKTDPILVESLPEIRWKGRWAIISQDNLDISVANTIALIPFKDNSFIEFPIQRKPKSVAVVNYRDEVSFKEWNWSNGIFKVDLEGQSIDEIAGFLIEMN